VDLPAVAAAPKADRRAEEPPPRAPKHAPAPRTRSEADRHAGFAIQVGAFADAAAADRVYQKLERKGFEVYVVPASRSGDGRSRVRVGTVGSREDAEALARRLKREEGLPTWVLSEGGS
jgi:cell division septation protein DedD